MKTKIICFSILMLLIATTYPVHGVFQKQGFPHSEPVSQASDWPMFRHDAQNTGCSDSLAPNTNQLRWQSSIADTIMDSTPVVANDKLYISTGWYYADLPPPNVTDFRSNEFPSFPEYITEMLTYHEEYWGGIYCLDATDGGQLWNVDMYAPNEPAVIDGRVYTTDLNLYSYWSELYCLNADTGGTIWTKTLSGLTISPTVVADDKIVVSTLDLYMFYGIVQCYDTDGVPLWSYPLPPDEIVWFSAPAIYDGKVYFISSDLYSYFGGKLYCLDLETGQYLWSQSVSSFIFYYGTTSPVCSDGRVYCLDFNINNYQSTLKCFNADTGSLQWYYNLGEVLSLDIPAINDNSAFVSGFDLYSYYCWLYRISLDNHTLIWKVPVPASGYYFGTGSPICAVDKVILVPSGFYSYTDKLYCYDISTGTLAWFYLMSGLSICSPSIADDTVYMADMNGYVYAIADQLKIAEISGGLFSISAGVQNIGDSTLTDVDWSIECLGGMLGLINQVDEGTITSLTSGTTDTVRALPIFGLGTVSIKVTVSMTGMTPIRKMAEAMVIGPFVMMTS
ncbi:MAG: PQQ-binding-like beta-propeller repeat protein [Candidatus Thermoplasmatota archaeon]|nr:PQQ-binding-like beta-propeller repeat protein [Candidatus Thermoplasmatota archaeon]MBU1940212.1 PQQ-binding-like beta-propeller repeat protein [Candidatus Thermoplasmatota archaeon]